MSQKFEALLYSIDMKRFQTALQAINQFHDEPEMKTSKSKGSLDDVRIIAASSNPKSPDAVATLLVEHYDDQLSDKKNVLRKIGAIVKKIIFSKGDWVPRSSILTEIYRLEKEHHEFSDSTQGTVGLYHQLLNLKRRVYDSLSVLSSAGVIKSRKQAVEYSARRELFYSASTPSGKVISFMVIGGCTEVEVLPSLGLV